MNRALILALSMTFWTAACLFQPGGGGSTQVAPDEVRAGAPARVGLQLTVWGAGGEIRNRYAELQLFYRLPNAIDYRKLQPVLLSRQSKQEVYEFTIPPPPPDATGEIEYYITFRFDGHENRVPGIKRIRIVP